MTVAGISALLLVVGCGEDRSATGADARNTSESSAPSAEPSGPAGEPTAPSATTDADVTSGDAALARLITSDRATEIVDLFATRYGTTAADLLAAGGSGARVGEVLGLGTALTAEETYAVVYAVGSFSDPFAKGSPGRPVEGRTAFLVVTGDGTLLGGGLHVEDLTAPIRSALGEPVALASLVPAG